MANRRRPKYIRTLTDFSGGLNVDAPMDRIAKNQLSRADNAVYSRIKALMSRPGTVPYMMGFSDAEVTWGVEWSRNDGTCVELVVTSDKKLYKILDADTKVEVTTLHQIPIGSFFWGDRFYFVDGEKFRYYDGTNVRDVIPATPDSALTGTPATQSPSMDAGSYTYKYTYIDTAGGESAPSAASATVTITSGQVANLSGVLVGPEGTISRNIYRSTDGYNYKKVLSINDNTTTTITDNITAALVGETLVANDISRVIRCTSFDLHPKSQRIFGSCDPSDRPAVYYSDSMKPWLWRSVSRIYPTTGDGPAKKVEAFGNGLLALYGKSAWVWSGVDPTLDAEWKKLTSVVGTTAAGTVCLTPNSLTMMGLGGIYSLNPALLDNTLVMLTTNEMVMNRAEGKVCGILDSMLHLDTCMSMFDMKNRRYMVTYGDDAETTKNNKILVLDWYLQAFSIFTGIEANWIYQKGNGVIRMCTHNGILTFGVGHKDYDPYTGQYKKIEFFARTKAWELEEAPDEEFNVKKTYRFFLACSQEEDTPSSISIATHCPYRHYFFNSVDLDESMIWGTDEWGNMMGWTDYCIREGVCRLQGSRFWTELSNNVIDEQVTIYGIGYEFKLKKAKGVKMSGSKLQA